MDEKKTRTDDSPLDLVSSLNEDQSLDCEDETEEIDEAFKCCVCLDVLYKPVVLACGHASCFWCVHKAMNGVGESHCPICRCPYSHFPGICQLLHFLLLKMYPVAYKRKEKQVLEEEKKLGCFSPQLGDNLSSSTFSVSSAMCSETLPYAGTCSNGKIHPSTTVEQESAHVLFHENTTTISGENNVCLEASRTLGAEKTSSLQNDPKDRACERVSIGDVLCVTCKQLIFRPAVLNCGHVYCQSCIAIQVDEAIKCQLCQSPHPKGFPKVCLELNHFLEERFSKEYALRKEAVQLQPLNCQQGSPSAGVRQEEKQSAQSSPTWSYLAWLGDRGLNVHIGAGCDYCGMYPIVGERYKCKDCLEEIGFDLCGECYNTRSKLPGRFNQQHTPEHKFELVKSNLIRSIMMRLVSEHSEDSSIPISDDASEDPEDGHATRALSDDAPENPEGDTHFTI